MLQSRFCQINVATFKSFLSEIHLWDCVVIKANACVNCAYTDIGAEYGDVRPLAWMHTLNVNSVQLLDVIDPNHAFVTELATVGCITWPQREHIINLVQPRDRNDKLLEFLTRRSVADFNNFINVLSKQQAHLVPLLATNGGGTYLMSLCISV